MKTSYEKAEQRLYVRIGQTEKKKIQQQAQANGYSMSEYILAAIKNVQVKDQKGFRDLFDGVRRISVDMAETGLKIVRIVEMLEHLKNSGRPITDYQLSSLIHLMEEYVTQRETLKRLFEKALL